MYCKVMKPVLDIALCFLILPIILLVSLLIAPLIYLEDKGSVFYIAPRLGKNKQIFNMYKFRTMKMNSEDLRNNDGSTFNSENDPRLTKIGKILRKTSLDELPQIINVLKQEMSFVGPRPDLPEHLDMYESKEVKKLNVLPGITGYNQAYFRNGVDWKTRLKNDVYYTENINVILDIKIIIKTVFTVLKSDGVFNG